jgi:hypothetical protein
MDENTLKVILHVFITVVIIFALISFVRLSLIGFNLDTPDMPKKLLQVVTIEGLQNPPDTSIVMNKSDAFCEKHRGSSGSLNGECAKLTDKNCNTASCCVLVNGKKCAAGNADGPTFNTDKNGKTKNLDFYYYQNKCYGSKCPST